MRDDAIFTPAGDAHTTNLVAEIDLRRADEGAGAKPCIAVIESLAFLRKTIGRRMQSAFSVPVLMYSMVSELEGQLGKVSPGLVILSLMQGNQARVSALRVLLELVPKVPVIVLASVNDVDLARAVLRLGAKGYIPVTAGFNIPIGAMRFVLAGEPMCRSTPWMQVGPELRHFGPSSRLASRGGGNSRSSA